MRIDFENIVSVSEANQNFSKVTRMVDEKGTMVILKKNVPRYVMMDYNLLLKNAAAEDADIDTAIARILAEQTKSALPKIKAPRHTEKQPADEERDAVMKIAICDDDAADAEEIRGYLLTYFEQNSFTGSIYMYNNCETLLEEFEPGRFDAIFLDIYFKGVSGVDAARRIRESDPNCLLVFITASDSHMRDGFALRAASYVEKPLTPEKLETAFTQCRKLFIKNARYIEITLSQRSFRVPLTRLIYIESMERSAFFHTDTDESFETRMKLNDVWQHLTGSSFLRCHQSFIVNMNYVTDIRGSDLVMKNGHLVPIRKSGRKEVVSALNEFFSARLFEGI